MNENNSPGSKSLSAAPKARWLPWPDLLGCAVLIALILRLPRGREFLRGPVNVMVERGPVPNDRARLAIDRIIMAHFAGGPQSGDGR